MKKIVLLLSFAMLTLGINGQSIMGAWESQTTAENGDPVKNVVIFANGYQVATWYHAETGKFIMCNGGSYSLQGDTMTETVEFDTNAPERVGSEVSFKIFVNDSILGVVGDDLKWNRVDNGSPGALNGAWLMSGRVKDGKTQERDTSGPRKTMKILSGTRFQWIAYNTEKKEFMGTGGGTYTTVDGKYTEKIEFFSRDDSKVGLSLEFDYSIIDGQWHHSGYSSKGDPIHEIWSPRE